MGSKSVYLVSENFSMRLEILIMTTYTLHRNGYHYQSEMYDPRASTSAQEAEESLN